MALQQHPRRPRRRALNLAGALAVGALVLAPSSAFASTVVATEGGGLAYRTADSELNDLTITDNGNGTITFSDAQVSVQVDPAQAPGCTKVDRVVTCSTPTSADPAGLPLRVELGGGDDRLDNQTAIRTTVLGGAGMDTILGASARDVITGGPGQDTVNSRGGNDYIDIGGSFPDSATCGDGEDRVVADLADTVTADCEIVQRIAGPTTPDQPTPPTTGPGGTTAPDAGGGQVVPTPIAGACQNDINGTEAADSLTGTPGGDNVLALGGNDRVNAVGGDDCLFGGNGADNLSGGAGRDFLSGEAGRDRLSGAGGADGLTGGARNDRLSGGAGNDRIAGGAGNDVLSGNGERDRLYGGAGNDRLSGGADIDRLYGGDGNDRLSGGAGVNRLYGGKGRDVIIARNGVRDTINCGAGRDTVRADRRDRVAANCENVSRS